MLASPLPAVNPARIALKGDIYRKCMSFWTIMNFWLQGDRQCDSLLFRGLDLSLASFTTSSLPSGSSAPLLRYIPNLSLLLVSAIIFRVTNRNNHFPVFFASTHMSQQTFPYATARNGNSHITSVLRPANVFPHHDSEGFV